MVVGSICSGIEAASVAWDPLGWGAAFTSDVDPFARAVLSHRFPNVPVHGDFTTIKEDSYESIDLLVGGTPCQSFSIAGLRAGMDDDRGVLALEYLRLAQRLRPRWLVWENVAGALSSNGGRDFGAFLGGLAQLGYGFAYRVLDAQYVRVDGYPYAVPQRRRRVFVVGHSGGAWQRAAAVLFERASLSGHPAPSRRSRDHFGPSTPSGVGTSGEIARTLTAGCRYDLETETLCLEARQDPNATGGVARSIGAKDTGHAVVSFDAAQVANKTHRRKPKPRAGALCSTSRESIVEQDRIRRLTPRECERLQGFPDDWTLVPYRGRPAGDGPRYRAIGNSMAVNVMRWIGRRIADVEAL